MTILHYSLVVISIIFLAIGTVGFLLRRWGIKMYMYIFVIVSITIFTFGIAPLILPSYPLERQIFTILVPSAGSVIVAYILLEIIERRKK